jgi:DNA-binding NarL/FixJ family response regulator
MTIKILLVDDNQTFIDAIKLFLGMVPGTAVVGEAHDGHAALTQVGALKPDLVLLDVAMPKMNGLEVARRLKTLPQPPRIIFLSMHNSEEYRTAASDLGVDEFVDKADFVVELFPILKRLTAVDADITGAMRRRHRDKLPT